MIHRRTFVKTITAGVSALSLSALAGRCSSQSKRPNIVFFFVDDMGWQDTSVPFHSDITPLNRRYYTPNLEKLAAEGKKFSQAYACAVCSPSRISLMTGLNAARHRVTNWTLRKNRSPDWKHENMEPPAWNMNGMSAVSGIENSLYARTLPTLLRDAGYRTIHAGKGHFGARGTPGEDPQNLGFDVNIAGHAAGGPGSYHGEKNYSAVWRNGDIIWDVPGLEEYHGRDINLTEALTRKANLAINDAVTDGKPFYLYLSHYAIHAPWEKDKRFIQKYLAAGLSEFDATYASMLEAMDKSLGDIRKNLKRLRIEDNTIIVFMSDNGAPSQAARNVPLRGHKLTPYEGGTRVPMIVSWPGITRPGSTCENYLIIEDIFPTFLEMAGIESFEQIGGEIDGISFVPLLKEGGSYPENRSIFWHYPHTYDQPPYSSVRMGDWKLIYFHDSRRLELYNLPDDLSEQNNQAQTNTGKLAEMAHVLSDFLRRVQALMPLDKRSGKAVEFPDERLMR